MPRVLAPHPTSPGQPFQPFSVPKIPSSAPAGKTSSILADILNKPAEYNVKELIWPKVAPSKPKETENESTRDENRVGGSLKPYSEVSERTRCKHMVEIRAKIDKLNAWLRSTYNLEIKSIDLDDYKPNEVSEEKKRIKIRYLPAEELSKKEKSKKISETYETIMETSRKST